MTRHGISDDNIMIQVHNSLSASIKYRLGNSGGSSCDKSEIQPFKVIVCYNKGIEALLPYIHTLSYNCSQLNCHKHAQTVKTNVTNMFCFMCNTKYFFVT